MEPWTMLAEVASQWGLPLNAEAIARLQAFYRLLLEGNKKANLTRITDETEAVFKHFLDALSVARAVEPAWLGQPLRMVDVGAGAGIPGLPLLLALPTWSGTLIEATRKKVDFMQEAIAAFDLTASAVHGRAEELGQQPEHRERYDLAVARAVAELNVLAELCLPLVRVGGRFVAMKGSAADSEIEAAERAITRLGGQVAATVRFDLPEGFGARTLVVVEKIANTPRNYPRRAGQPASKPLC